MSGLLDTQEQLEYKENLNYAILLLTLLTNVSKALAFGYDGFKEFEVLWIYITSDIKETMPDVGSEYTQTKDRIARIPTYGARYDRTQGYITWQQDIYNIKKQFVMGFAMQKVMDCLNDHHLLLYTAQKLETGRL